MVVAAAVLLLLLFLDQPPLGPQGPPGRSGLCRGAVPQQHPHHGRQVAVGADLQSLQGRLKGGRATRLRQGQRGETAQDGEEGGAGIVAGVVVVILDEECAERIKDSFLLLLGIIVCAPRPSGATDPTESVGFRRRLGSVAAAAAGCRVSGHFRARVGFARPSGLAAEARNPPHDDDDDSRIHRRRSAAG